MTRLMTMAVILALSTGAAQARGNAEAGKARAAQVCAACHGADGNKPSAPDQPVLAGQYYDTRSSWKRERVSAPDFPTILFFIRKQGSATPGIASWSSR